MMSPRVAILMSCSVIKNLGKALVNVSVSIYIDFYRPIALTQV